MMKNQKTVFLDADTLALPALYTHPKWVCFPRTTPDEIETRLAEAQIAITNKCVLTATHFKRLPKLKLICVAATGVNNIDLAAAKAARIAVSNVAGYSTDSVAEHAFLFLLAFSHRLRAHEGGVFSGDWSRSPHFTLLNFPYRELKGKTLGIVGYGAIGKALAKRAKAFGLKVLVARLRKGSYPKSPARVPLKTLLSKSDFVSLHCALSRETTYLINRDTLSLMKPSAYLLNLARGPVVEETHLVEALRANKIAGYGSDVLALEPPPADHPFFDLQIRDKILLTPHIAWASEEARLRIVEEIEQNIAAFIKGKPRNRV